MQSKELDEQLKGIETPAYLSAELGLGLQQLLTQGGISCDEMRDYVSRQPFCLLQGVFVPNDLPTTPEGFIPVPQSSGTIVARVAVLAINGFLNLETISYGSENEGHLFVNIVRIPGEGAFAEKSAKNLRGHTDAVSFPFNNESDPENPRIAPSPDIVTLVGLRNPHNVPTKVMPLNKVLPLLTEQDIEELKKAQYSIRSQRTFHQGMKATLGKVLTVLGVPILKDVLKNTYVRYSHSSVSTEDEISPASMAAENFENACETSAIDVVINPGDICIINNRTSLHGRGIVGDDIAGDSRWLLRSYALDTSRLPSHKRHDMHILFP